MAFRLLTLTSSDDSFIGMIQTNVNYFQWAFQNGKSVTLDTFNSYLVQVELNLANARHASQATIDALTALQVGLPTAEGPGL